MSIILKGIDLPSKPTQIRIYPNGIIFCANNDGMYVPKYQAIQIPTDHGRLIDGDELKANYTEDDDVYTPWLRKDIDNAPTILESEE